MTGLLDFVARFRTEAHCIAYLADLRWPGGYCCANCRGRSGWQLPSRPRTWECAACHHQASVTSGTILHRTRTALPKWFLAAYLMGNDKRGVSASHLQRALGVRYETAWTMAHKLRHGLSEADTRVLGGLVEADETYVGGHGDTASRGRGTAHPDKSLVVAAVEKRPLRRQARRKHCHAVKRQHGFRAGSLRIGVLKTATAPALGAFLRANIAARSHLLTDAFASYRSQAAALSEHLRHTPVVQGAGAAAGEHFPIIHTLFSNMKAWLVGTHHGVSAKHLPRYLREWAYRFNRRFLDEGPALYLIRRAVECATITYNQLVRGEMINGAERVRRGAAASKPALTG